MIDIGLSYPSSKNKGLLFVGDQKRHYYARRQQLQNNYYNQQSSRHENLIVHAVTSDNFPFGRGAPLQEDRKFVMMGGANFHLVEILALVCRSSVRMLLVLRVQKICSHQKYMAGTLELDTPSQQ
jgi:hypothetical protein